jgi:hypothetical protein
MQNPFYRLDFSEIDDFDPSLVDGYRVLYDRELCCHVRYQDKYTECRDMPQPESLTVRVLLMVTIWLATIGRRPQTSLAEGGGVLRERPVLRLLP